MDRSQQLAEKSKLEFETKVITHNNETKKFQESVFQQTENVEMQKKDLMEQENYNIKLVLGMSLIKKY